MTEGSGSRQIFISYAREDHQLAKLLAEGLETLGWLVWWDPAIRFGRSFRSEIAEALDDVDCVIVLWSKDAVRSDWVCAEADKARGRKVLIPIMLDDVELPLPFGESQTADFTIWQGSRSAKVFRELVRQVKELAGPPLPKINPGRVARLSAAAPVASRDKIVVLFDHADGDFLQKEGSTKVSDFVKFLEAAGRDLGFELWWDTDRTHEEWDSDVEDILEKAAVVVLVTSISFLVSSFATSPRAQRMYHRLKREGVPLIRVRYRVLPSHPFSWLSEMLAVPKEGKPIERRRLRGEVYKELTDLIQKLVRDRPRPIRDERALRTIRLSPVSGHSPQQLKLLQKDACDRAFKFVPNPKKHEQISKAARKLGAIEGGQPPLSKELLAKLDEEFLARDEGRQPDPKKIRWILRCKDLHPQAKVVSVGASKRRK